MFSLVVEVQTLKVCMFFVGYYWHLSSSVENGESDTRNCVSDRDFKAEVEFLGHSVYYKG